MSRILPAINRLSPGLRMRVMSMPKGAIVKLKFRFSIDKRPMIMRSKILLEAKLVERGRCAAQLSCLRGRLIAELAEQ